MYGLAGTTVVALAGVGAVVGAWSHAVGQLEHVAVAGLADRAGTDGTDGSSGSDGSVNVLVAGLTRTEEGGRRADPVTLVRYDPGERATTLLTLPPDLLVTRCDGEHGWLTDALAGPGGVGCLVETVRDAVDVPVHHLVAVELSGLAEVVTLLRGVRVPLDTPIEVGDVELPAGCVDVAGGTEVLAVARAGRHDVARGIRQAALARGVAAEVAAWPLLVDIPRVLALGDAAGRSVVTDVALSVTDVHRLLAALRDVDRAGTDARIVPATERTVGGLQGTVVRADAAAPLLAALRDGGPLPDDVGTTPPAPLQPADVPPLLVLNGTEAEGLAADTAERLGAAGFAVDDIGDAERDDFDRTLVIFPDALREEAGLLADAFADAAVVPGDPGEPLTVVLGRDHDPALVGRGLDERSPDPGTTRPSAVEVRC